MSAGNPDRKVYVYAVFSSLTKEIWTAFKWDSMESG